MAAATPKTKRACARSYKSVDARVKPCAPAAKDAILYEMSLKRKIFVGFALMVSLGVLVVRNGTFDDLSEGEVLARYANVQSAFLRVDGMNVHYRDTGVGPPIVLLHGNSSSLHAWEGWAKALETHRRVIRLDLPGFGLTGPDPSGKYDFFSQSQFLAHFLDALGIQGQVDVAGNSHGGRVAWTFATAFPERVRKLIMINAAGYPMGLKLWGLKLRGLWPISWIASWYTPRAVVRVLVRDTFGDPAKVTDEIVDHYHGLQLVPGNRASLAAMSSIYGADDTALIVKVAKPTLILWGAKDKLFPVEDARRFEKDIAGAKVILYEGVGHLPMEEIPELSARDADAFLDEAAK